MIRLRHGSSLTLFKFVCCAVEERPPGHVCGKDEVAYESSLKDVDVVAAEEHGGREESADYEDEMDEEEDQAEPEDEADDSDGSSGDLEEAVARRKGAPSKIINASVQLSWQPLKQPTANLLLVICTVLVRWQLAVLTLPPAAGQRVTEYTFDSRWIVSR